ncbi:E3 ubiquitin-protein ligase RHA2A-like [Olea europaea var. sylvestris]|uniref:E3 ubiquitin- ligase RHA2A-like n=1 Tax=Olea europaea subsp. europaea TaxID=158383 RepID=A0A8S0PKA1_OLEEU|nr:E3 ubiquitin-protein ligase RHA2A-like [Olea europaea var. sylvestris]CAA2949638.1 E3 ubiquitin- ligase RHA2A-like [Olea europaea subsp. europaea]
MGLQSQLSDVSSESILLLFIVLIGKTVRYLQSLLFTILHNLGFILPRFDSTQQFENSSYDVVGSGLAGLIFLCEQLNLNRVFSYTNQFNGCEGADLNCVVCLNQLGKGDHVRKLACRHVFHKECFDGWLEHLNFNCPLCRMPLVSDERVELTQKRVTGDVLSWFPLQ